MEVKTSDAQLATPIKSQADKHHQQTKVEHDHRHRSREKKKAATARADRNSSTPQRPSSRRSKTADTRTPGDQDIRTAMQSKRKQPASSPQDDDNRDTKLVRKNSGNGKVK